MRRWVEEGLEDWPHGRPPGVRKVDLKAIDAVQRLQQNPNLGAFRVHAAPAQIGVHLSPRTCGRILATNSALYGLSSRRWTNLMLSNHVPELSSRAGDPGSGSASSASSIPPKPATRSRTRRRTVGYCAPWATRSRRYGVSSTPVGRRSEYRNSASATAINKIRRSCHNRCPAGVFMSKPTETLEDTWQPTPGSRRPN